jgi:hypothetical protein
MKEKSSVCRESNPDLTAIFKFLRHPQKLVLDGIIKTRDENPTGPGFGPGPKTLIFLNFKNPEPGPKPECDFPETLNPNPNPNFKNLGPAENLVQFFYKTEIGK